MTEKLFRVSRQNPIDREAAAKDIGYSGLTGQSSKMLADLAHFDLVEKAGKGGLRVTDLAVRILHPRNPIERIEALSEAAYAPSLYSDIRKQWPDGFISENALRGHLMRSGFSSAAVAPALTSFFETYRFLQAEGAIESHGQTVAPDQNSTSEASNSGPLVSDARAVAVVAQPVQPPIVASEPRKEGHKMMDGERIVFVEEGGPAQYLKLVASGDLDETLLEALEDYIKRQKKRLAATRASNLK